MKMTKNVINRWLPLFIFFAILGIVFLLWRGAWIWIDVNITESTQKAADAAIRGQFGDKFGAINALFSGLAFAGIIFTIYLQRGDLRETQRAMGQERFDNTFFQLLNVHISITENITVGGGGHKGRQAFERFVGAIKVENPEYNVFSALQKLERVQVESILKTSNVDQGTYPALSSADVSNVAKDIKENHSEFITRYIFDSSQQQEIKVVAAYIKAAAQYIDDFSHYFRNLYHILKFLNDSDLISESDKVNYSRFIRSQLSQVELVSLFYNSISVMPLPGKEGLEMGCPKMGKLLRRFDMLQNMNPKNIFHASHMEIFLKNNKMSSDK